MAWLAALVVLGPVILLLAHTLPEGRPVRSLSRLLARAAVALTGCRVTVDGAKHLPEGGPIVLVANHASYADTVALLAALPGDYCFVAMREVLSWPLVGTLARRGRHLLVDRHHVRESLAGATAVEQRLRDGSTILVFAEGGISAARGLRPFRLGAFQAAVAAGAPVLPIALRGTREVLRASTRVPRPGRMYVWVGVPLSAHGRDWRAVVDLRNRTVDAIAQHAGEPSGP